MLNFIEKYFYPTYYFDDIYEITPGFLKSAGIAALVCDIDNTLVTYDDACPTASVLEWFGKLEEEEIQISFVSNNNPGRVEAFNRELGYFASAKSGKPGAKKLYEAMTFMKTDEKNTALLGDQILTDILAGSHIGLKTILVYPIKDKKTLFFRFKRAIEKPVLKSYFKNREIKRVHYIF